MQKVWFALVLSLAVSGCYSKSDVNYFEFIDSGCGKLADATSPASVNYEWDGKYSVAVIESTFNCSQFAQKPTYQLVQNEIIFSYETISPEKGALAPCECAHEVIFRLRTEKEYSIKVLENGVPIE